MPNLVSAGAFRLVHRGIGGLDEAFDDLPVKVFISRRQSDAADTQAGESSTGACDSRSVYQSTAEDQPQFHDGCALADRR